MAIQKGNASISSARKTAKQGRSDIEAARKTASSFSKMRGTYTNTAVHKYRTVIMKADSILRAQDFNEDKDVSIYKTKKLAVDLLYDLDCAIVPIPRSYSLVGTQTTDLQTGNETIADPQVALAQNQRVKANNSFPNECDPFYKLDEESPRNISKANQLFKNRQRPDLTITAASVAQLNFLKSPKISLKEFLDPIANKRGAY